MGIFGSSGRPAPGSASVPAVVVAYGLGRDSGATPPEGWDGTCRVTASVRLLDGDGSVHHVKGRQTGLVQWLMAEGDVVPVLVDGDGRVVGFDRDGVEAAYAGRRDEARADKRRFSAVLHDLREDLGGLRQLPGALRDVASVPRRWVRAAREPVAAAPVAPPVEPVEGVGFETFVAVQAALVRERVPRDRHDEVAVRLGVAPGRWAVAGPAWHDRIRRDPAAAQAFGAAYQAAMRER